MTNYDIKPFSITPDFKACWMAAGKHLNLRVRDAGASWLRAELPPFREHLSFALGNQIFFLQIMDAQSPKNGWVQPDRLNSVVKDANGIGCLMPMRLENETWRPIELGWGLIDYRSKEPINPFELVTDEQVEMTQWEIHDVGIQAVRQHLVKTGWKIDSWQNDLHVDPSIFAHKDGQLSGFVVRTSNLGPDKAGRPANASNIAEQMRERGWGAKFVGMKVASHDVPWHIDPRLQHLTRKINRRSPLMLSKVDIEELAAL